MLRLDAPEILEIKPDDIIEDNGTDLIVRVDAKEPREAEKAKLQTKITEFFLRSSNQQPTADLDPSVPCMSADAEVSVSTNKKPEASKPEL